MSNEEAEELCKKYTDEEIKENIKDAYNKIKKILGTYLDMQEENKEVIALWIIGTYFHDNFETFPYLFLNAMRGSGKTRALKIITKLAKEGSILISLTEAALFRSQGTLGIDEFEGLASKEKQSLRELLNAGYKKGIGVVRMKKQKTLNGEEIVPERFECYRPIVMANIWGMEEVLGDRCISIIMEKSNNPLYTRLIENFENNPSFLDVLLLLNSDKCRLCRVVTVRNIYMWNNFITALYTQTPLTTLTTLTTQEQERLQKIHDTNIDGRNLELYFPLLQVSEMIGDDIFNNFLKIATDNVENRRIDEVAESKDVSMFQFISTLNVETYYKMKDLVQTYRLTLGEDGNFDWLNTKWMGRALKRLNLTIHKRRVSDSREVMLNIQKAKEKLEMFK